MVKRGGNRMLDSAGEMAESAMPTFDSFMATAKPILKEGKKIAKQKAKRARKAAKAAVEPEKKGNKVKKLLLLAGLIGLGSVIVRRLLADGSKGNWQPAYSPQPAPAPGHVADDTGGAGPDEALSDAAAGPHPDTTPDEPVEVVELEDDAPEAEAPRKPDPLTDPLPDPLTDPLPPAVLEPEPVAEEEPPAPPKRPKKAAKPQE